MTAVSRLLLALSPRWIHPHVFVFECPHRCGQLLSCKDAPMTQAEQHALFDEVFGEDGSHKVTPTRPEFAWTIDTRDFATMTVTPSIDGSPSGCWHGFITKGEIR